MSLQKKLAEYQKALDEADRERRGATLLLAAVIKKFGGRVILSKVDMDSVTEYSAVETHTLPAQGEIILTVGVNPQYKGKLRSTHG